MIELYCNFHWFYVGSFTLSVLLLFCSLFHVSYGYSLGRASFIGKFDGESWYFRIVVFFRKNIYLNIHNSSSKKMGCQVSNSQDVISPARIEGNPILVDQN
jgi:hypothetical protein